LRFPVVCYCHSDRTLKHFRHFHITVNFSTKMHILTLQVQSVKIFDIHKILYFSQHVKSIRILSELHNQETFWRLSSLHLKFLEVGTLYTHKKKKAVVAAWYCRN
jgi:hypothetical protein